MQNGFIKVAAVTPKLKVADCGYNCEEIIKLIGKLEENKVDFAVFPELSVTGYTCGDLFLQKQLLVSAYKCVIDIVKSTYGKSILVAFGTPLVVDGNLYNVAVMAFNGKVLGIVPKTYLPSYNEFYDTRHFVKAPNNVKYIQFGDEMVPFGNKILFTCRNNADFSVSLEICEDLWAPSPPSVSHALNGANIIANLSASNEIIGKAEYRRMLVSSQSARLISGYIYASSGYDESTTDMIFSGHDIICENGTILSESKLFNNGYIISEIDLDRLSHDRRRITSFEQKDKAEYEEVFFDLIYRETELTREILPFPFVPKENADREKRCEEILEMQTYALIKRVEHIGAKSIVVGISGGLDSSLALLVMVNAFKIMNRPMKDIIAVTMPCFGTSNRTKNNAIKLCKLLGVTLLEIDISEAVKVHLKDINHLENNYDVTYENAQARERTQVLMDIANQSGGIVIGTGDLSEMALGWSTYNGDHMSMYAVNCTIPKTLIKYIIEYFAKSENTLEAVREVLNDILTTPISPELLPGDNIGQKTEDIIGSYELNDFFLYYMIRWGFTPKKICFLACNAFCDKFSTDEIKERLKNFYKRFFNNQFKRSCIPDGPKVGTVALSPRSDWRMPSDACGNVWLNEVYNI